MKKVFILLLILTVAAAPLNSFAAKSTDGLEKALSIVKQRLDIGDSYDEFNSNSRAENGTTVYSFSWNDKDGSESVNADISENGIITSYDYYIQKSESEYLPEFSDNKRAAGREAAESFLKKINPEYAENFVLEPEPEVSSLWNHGRFIYDISVKVNGIPISGASGHIIYSSALNKVTSFYVDADFLSAKIDFVKTDKIISRDEAIKAYKEKLGLKLVYRMYTDKDDSLKVYAAYNEASNKNGYIDALTGEVYYPENRLFYSGRDNGVMNTMSDAKKMEAASEAYGFSNVEKNEIETVAGLITQEAAQKIVRDNPIINLSKNAELGTISLSRDFYESKKYAYFMTFYTPTDKQITQEKVKLMIASGDVVGMNIVTAVVDAANGNITSFAKYAETSEKNKVSAEKAHQTADKTLAALGGALHQTYKLSSDKTDDSYSFVYTREVNGASFISNTATVEINPADGSVCLWSYACSEVDFPPVTNIISSEDAVNSLFEEVKYEPMYMPTYDESGRKINGMRLVYCITDNNFINIAADNGALVSYDNVPQTKDEVVKYTDISGHYAEEAVKTLAKYGIAISGTDKFKPDEKIKQKDFLAMVLMCFESYENLGTETEEDIRLIYDASIRSGLITAEERNPDVYVSRLEATTVIIRAMGYDNLAGIEEMYNCPFSDVTMNKGYVSILYYLGIMSGDGNGSFRPDDQMARAEAAMVIYNYLSTSK